MVVVCSLAGSLGRGFDSRRLHFFHSAQPGQSESNPGLSKSQPGQNQEVTKSPKSMKRTEEVVSGAHPGRSKSIKSAQWEHNMNIMGKDFPSDLRFIVGV